MAIVRKTFVISSATGSSRFTEGMEVAADIAKLFPQFMVGFAVPQQKPHDPTLPEKLTRAAAEKLKDERLEAWVEQYYPSQVPSGKLKREDLLDLVVALQE